VFVFASGQSGGYCGSLPGIGISVHDMVGMARSSHDQGYFLVGQDGGVFAFGDAPCLAPLPGRIHVTDVIGIAATPSVQGSWSGEADGAVYGFGNADALGGTFGSSSPVAGITSTADGGDTGS